jgi:hypothetical protein
MKTKSIDEKDDELRPEYDLSSLLKKANTPSVMSKEQTWFCYRLTWPEISQMMKR